MGYLYELDKPNLTEEQLFEYLRDDEDLPVTRRSIKYAVMRREIRPTRIGPRNYFSNATASTGSPRASGGERVSLGWWTQSHGRLAPFVGSAPVWSQSAPRGKTTTGFDGMPIGTATYAPSANSAPVTQTQTSRCAACVVASAYTRWANTDDRSMATWPARKAFEDKFDREVDPEGKLTPKERAKRAGFARKAYYQRLAMKSVQARRRRKQQ